MRLLKWSLLVFYFVALIYIVCFAPRRQELVWHENIVNLVPIQNTIDTFHDLKGQGWVNFSANLFGNIILFLPIPFFIMDLFKASNKILIVAAGFLISIFIECAQYFWRIGIPDIDDVLLNTIGIFIGIFLYNLLFKK